MRPLVLAVLVAASVAASAQTHAPAPFEVGLAVSRSPTVAGTAGDAALSAFPAVVLGIDASGRIYRHAGADVRLGGVLRAASTAIVGDVDLTTPALHHLGLYANVGTRLPSGARADALAGVSLDLGPDLYALDGVGRDASLSTDTQDALWLGARYTDVGAGVADGLVVYASADAFLTRRRSVTVPYTTPDDPGGTDSTITFLVDFGDALNASIGGSNRVGPLDVGLALHVSGRTRSSSEVVGAPRPFRNRGALVLSVVPSVAYHAASGLGVELAMRAPGVFVNEHAVHGVPLLVRRTRVGAVPLSLRVGYRW